MKTAMQQLIEWIDTPNLYPDRISIKEKATELLEEEKRQIVEAYDEAEGKIIGNGEQYYNQRYNNENKQDTVQ